MSTGQVASPCILSEVLMIKNKELILERWAEYLQNLLCKVHTTAPGFLDDLSTLPIIQKLDDPPSFDGVEKAILNLKDNKTSGPDNIPAEVIKYGGWALHRGQHYFIVDCWSAKCLPQQWKNANKSLVHHHLMPQLSPLVGISLKTQKSLHAWAQMSL